MKYTVIGYYEDNGQLWMEFTSGKDASAAVVNAVHNLERRNGNDEDDKKWFRSNVCIVEVIRGHHKGQADGDSVSAAIDWPGLEVEDD